MIIVFDGVCNVCNRWVGFLLTRDRNGSFQFAHCQSGYGAKVMKSLHEKPNEPSTVVLIDSNKVYVRSTAILRALAALGGLWPAVLILLIVPRPVRDAAYRCFASLRYRLFGRTEKCQIPEAHFRDRFLP